MNLVKDRWLFVLDSQALSPTEHSLVANGWCRVPYMEDGAVALTDSLCMILYILERYGVHPVQSQLLVHRVPGLYCR